MIHIQLKLPYLRVQLVRLALFLMLVLPAARWRTEGVCLCLCGCGVSAPCSRGVQARAFGAGLETVKPGGALCGLVGRMVGRRRVSIPYLYT